MTLFHHIQPWSLIRRVNIEALVWISALLVLGCINPAADQHFTLCFFKNLGISFCPGCGLGHSISYLLHGEIRQSFAAHPLGVFAFCILIHRIYQLLKPTITLSSVRSR